MREAALIGAVLGVLSLLSCQGAGPAPSYTPVPLECFEQVGTDAECCYQVTCYLYDYGCESCDIYKCSEEYLEGCVNEGATAYLASPSLPEDLTCESVFDCDAAYEMACLECSGGRAMHRERFVPLPPPQRTGRGRVCIWTWQLENSQPSPSSSQVRVSPSTDSK